MLYKIPLDSLTISTSTNGRIESPKVEVSVVIAAYNVSAHVDRALDSAIVQTMPDIEILVVDDASSDDTADRVASMAASDPRIRLMQQEQNGGPARARNRALQSAQGRWIAVLDADDTWVPNRLRRLLDASAERDMVFDNLMGFDLHSGRTTGPIFPQLPLDGLTLEELLAPAAPGTTYDFGYLQPLMRTAFLRKHKIAYLPELRVNEDLILSVMALMAGARTATVPDSLYVYTTPVGGQSGRPSSASKTIPGATPVYRVLSELLERHGETLSAMERAAFQRRLDHIVAVGGTTLFRHAQLRGNYVRMAHLLATKPELRRRVWQRICQRLAS